MALCELYISMQHVRRRSSRYGRTFRRRLSLRHVEAAGDADMHEVRNLAPQLYPGLAAAAPAPEREPIAGVEDYLQNLEQACPVGASTLAAD
jgi:hypothetical protein